MSSITEKGGSLLLSNRKKKTKATTVLVFGKMENSI